jgi:hypothetical protein
VNFPRSTFLTKILKTHLQQHRHTRRVAKKIQKKLFIIKNHHHPTIKYNVIQKRIDIGEPAFEEHVDRGPAVATLTWKGKLFRLYEGDNVIGKKDQ